MVLELALGPATVTRRPALKKGVLVRRLASGLESYCMIKEPDQQKYYKFEIWEGDLLDLFDGTRDHKEIAAEFSRKHPTIPVDEQWVLDSEEQFRKLDLIERPVQERHLLMMGKLKSLRKRRFVDTETAKLLLIRFPLFDPDAFLNRLMPRIRWAWSPWFVGASVLAFVVLFGVLIRHWNLYWAGFFDLVTLTGKGPGHLLTLVFLLTLVSLWHEMGHALTLKRFGGEVHDIGFMLFYLQPAFYCNVDDSYIFPKVSHRVYVTFGGAYFELLMCGAATAIWLTTPAEWWVHNAALAVVFITGFMAVWFNVNPLIKMDGYYVLMDVLDVPDLREESFEYVRNLFKKHLFHLEVAQKPVSRRRRRIFLIYGLLAMTYTAVFLTIVFLFFRGLFLKWMGPVGLPVLLALATYLLRRKLAAAAHFVKHLWLDKRDLLRPGPRRLGASGLLVALVAVLTIPRCSTRIEAEFVVEPGSRAVVRAPADGFVRSVAVVEGASVRRGDWLAALENPELTAARAAALSDLARARRERIAARERGDPATSRGREAEEREAAERLQRVEALLERMVLVAPGAGVVSTRDLESKPGRFLAEGEPFCEVDELRHVNLDVSALESDMEEIRQGGEVRLLATAFPTRPLSTRVRSINALARTPAEANVSYKDVVRRVNLLRVLVEVDNEGGLLRPGMTGRAQFLGRPRSLAGNVLWRLSRWLGILVW
jgi:putative peptide zinc metalloprotease protein